MFKDMYLIQLFDYFYPRLERYANIYKDEKYTHLLKLYKGAYRKLRKNETKTK